MKQAERYLSEGTHPRVLVEVSDGFVRLGSASRQTPVPQISVHTRAGDAGSFTKAPVWGEPGGSSAFAEPPASVGMTRRHANMQNASSLHRDCPWDPV
eukprot:365259-Chlamydomonas_euryale.AAC.9